MHDDPMNIPADSSLGPRVTYMYDAGPRTVGLATPASCRTNFPYDTMTGTLKQEVPRSAGTPRLSPSREQEFALEIRYHLAQMSANTRFLSEKFRTDMGQFLAEVRSYLLTLREEDRLAIEDALRSVLSMVERCNRAF